MIRFEAEDVQLPTINQQQVTGWIYQVAALHQKAIGEINYIFCSDSKILEHNQHWLQHDFYTDIITFDYSRGDVLSGDMYIGFETVLSNAEEMKLKPERELMRVIIHGILHLIGFKDKTPEDESIMHEQEDVALSHL